LQMSVKIFLMAIEYINILQSRTLQNLPKLGFLVWKRNHLATLIVLKDLDLLGSMLWSQFSSMFANLWRKNWCYSKMIQLIQTGVFCKTFAKIF
jgi:hypothetical protein